jgi:hypothetical protein
MHTHPKVSDVIEVDHPRSTSRVHRLTKECADNDLGTAGLVHEGMAQIVIAQAKLL